MQCKKCRGLVVAYTDVDTNGCKYQRVVCLICSEDQVFRSPHRPAEPVCAVAGCLEVAGDEGVCGYCAIYAKTRNTRKRTQPKNNDWNFRGISHANN